MSSLVGLRIDIETKSSTDIKFGVYRYAEDPDFAVLIIRYAPIREVNGKRRLGSVRGLDGNEDRFRKLLADETIEKHAYNAQFERICLSKWLGMPNGTYLDPRNWHCTAVRANAAGVFGTLEEVATALRAPINKDKEGKALIKFFSVPRKGGGFSDPAEHPTQFTKYESYCTQDVQTEAAVAALTPDVIPEVQREYEEDQRINDRGVGHNKRLALAAVAQVEAEKDRLMTELTKLTGVANPNSIQQMQAWLSDQNYPMKSLAKDKREAALEDPDCPPIVAKALTLKGAASLSSVQKHKAALDTRCADGRIRGSLRFYGAHTGREAGRGIQPQNLPRYEASAADRRLLVSGNAGTEAPRIAKGTVRASLVPARGNVFVVPDYNAIEARCLGWQAGEQWVQDEFDVSKGGAGKIYEATASMMLGVNKQALIAALKGCGKCGTCADCAVRSKGKVSDLALGYAGGAGALVTMGAEAAGIDCGNYVTLNAEWAESGTKAKFHEWERDRHDYPELIRMRDLYRDNRPATVAFWKQCARAWDNATLGRASRFGSLDQFTMTRDGLHNRLTLPSGRSIWYRFARSHPDEKNPERIDRRTFIGKGSHVGHTRIDTHGGSLTENITQAVARDVLFDLILRVRALGPTYPGKVVLHVHDEVVLEVPKAQGDQVLADVLGLMGTPPDWAPGLFVKGEGRVMDRYGK